MVAPVDLVPELRRQLEALANPEKATAMAAYMKDRFEFFGVTSHERRRAHKPFLASGRQATAGRLLDAADACWTQPEREFQYTAVDLLRRWNRALTPESLPRIERLVREKPWWDTVDALASNVVGSVVAAHPELAAAMDQWIDDPDLWIARTAILHQLKYGPDTDVDRLFGYVDRRSADTDFFIRKACGWALRQYARHDPDAVREYVADRGDQLSALTRSEATKHL